MAQEYMQNNPEIIDLREVLRKIWSKKKLITIVTIIVAILSCAWILPQPRYYSTEVTLAPEMENIAGGGGLADIAASFGFDLGEGGSSDAIYPTLYPDLMKSSEFIIDLFDVPVTTSDGTVQTDYYTYLTQHQQQSPMQHVRNFITNLRKKIIPDEQQPVFKSTQEGKRFNPFSLSRKESMVVEGVQDLIECDVDIKTSVITITVTDQDKLVCATMADSVRVRLQNYIINYRTQKARHNYDYYKALSEKAKAEYDIAVKEYSDYSDSHQNALLQAYISERDKLESEMELKYQAYSTLIAQVQAAEVKVREQTPVFTVLQCATIPQKPFKPKRMIFILGMMFLAIVCTSLYIAKEDIFSQLLDNKQS